MREHCDSDFACMQEFGMCEHCGQGCAFHDHKLETPHGPMFFCPVADKEDYDDVKETYREGRIWR